jgi:hypothetical protein
MEPHRRGVAATDCEYEFVKREKLQVRGEVREALWNKGKTHTESVRGEPSCGKLLYINFNCVIITPGKGGVWAAILIHLA